MSLVQAIAAPSQITTALQQASARTGTDFNYLLKTAMRESSLNCDAKSSTSSACGLFQFTEQSWLGTMKQDGGDLGLGKYADQISRNSSGRYVVTDPAARQEILALRNDPKVSALMAGAYTNDSQSRLESRLGRSVSGGELYIAHFLGAGGATKLISNAQDAPNTPADRLFPAAAAANRSIFYESNGSSRSVEQVYNNLVAKHRNVSTGDGTSQSATGLKTGRAAPRMASAQDFSAVVSTAASPAAPSYRSPSSSAYSSPTPSPLYNFASSAGGLSTHSTLTLTPGVVEILSSLDAPKRSENDNLEDIATKRDERQARLEELNTKRIDERKTASLLLPMRGRALG